MVKGKIKKILGMMLVVGFVILGCYLINAVAVSGTYSNRRPLEVSPGETKSITFVLQNMADENDVKFKALISEGSEIVRITDSNTEYLVPVGSNDVPVKLSVEVPSGAEIGIEYQIKIEFEPVSTGNEEEGMVQVMNGLSRYFIVKVVEKSEEESPMTKGMLVYIGIIIVLLLMIVFLIAYILKNRIGKKKVLKK